MADDKKPTIFARQRAKRAQKLAPIGDVRLEPTAQDMLIELLSDGAMLPELIEDGLVPSFWHVWNTCAHDPVFDARYRTAVMRGATVMLKDAQTFAIEEAESGDPDRIRVADAVMRITETYAQKLAPREFGQLVKLAGDPDAPLTLQVISYVAPIVALDVMEAQAIGHDEVQASRARDTDEDGQATSQGHELAGTHEGEAATPSPR